MARDSSRRTRSCDMSSATRAKRAARRLPSPLASRGRCLPRAARRGKTIVAGYPWFTDWGRDTFIALRGSASPPIASTRHATSCSSGRARSPRACCPIAFPTRRGSPSSTRSTPRSGSSSPSTTSSTRRRARHDVADAIARARGCRRRDPGRLRGAARASASALDEDGLLAAGVPGVQLTWMDAKVGDQVDHAAHRQAGRDPGAVAQRAVARRVAVHRAGASCSSAARGVRGALLERSARRVSTTSSTSIISPGTVDPSLRPIRSSRSAACPFVLVDEARARRRSTSSRRACWTPLGLRSLAPDEPGYSVTTEAASPRATALSPGHGLAVAARPLRRGLGPRARRQSAAAKRRGARSDSSLRCFDHLDEAGLGHISEIADGDARTRTQRLPVPGLVGRRGAATRANRSGTAELVVTATPIGIEGRGGAAHEMGV